MKRLFLIRHAKSSWKNPDLPDFDRPLNKRGEHDAPLMGQRLHKIHVRPDLIIASPARRALFTAKIIAEKINYPQKEIVEDIHLYMANIREFLDVVQNLKESAGSALLVGHNPGITDFSNYLTGGNIENIPTCGMVCVEILVDAWKSIEKGLGNEVFFDYPKKHA
jgi:phosphohistidine phosphatase